MPQHLAGEDFRLQITFERRGKMDPIQAPRSFTKIAPLLYLLWKRRSDGKKPCLW
jgi:hypothetical protein